MIIPQLQKIIISKYTFPLALTFRILNLIVVKSYFVPDEYWQSLEVAHNFVFGYGYLTWEWQQGIRNYLHAVSIAVIYKLLQILHIDHPFLLTFTPRLAHAIFSAYADSCFVQWVRKETNVKQASYALYCYLSCWFISYCATRTLINTVELNLTCIALFYYPSHKHQNSDSRFLWIVSLICVMRPTGAIVWLPLCVFHIYESQNVLKTVINYYLPIGLTTLLISTLIDSYFYGALIFTSFRFLRFNIVHNISAHYGINSFLWYIFEGLPTILGPFFIPLIRGPSRLNPLKKKLIYSVLFSLLVYSFVPHKEHRFLLPLMPAMMFIVSDRMFIWLNHLKNQRYTNWILIFVLTVNISILTFFGMFHQIGSISVLEKIPRVDNTNLLFLTPCHSTPLYSHIHANISTRFLTCEPNLKAVSNYIDEADMFYKNPMRWLMSEFKGVPFSELPTHIVLYDKLLDSILPFLQDKNYRLIERIFHSYIITDDRISSHICLLEKYKQ